MKRGYHLQNILWAFFKFCCTCSSHKSKAKAYIANSVNHFSYFIVVMSLWNELMNLILKELKVEKVVINFGGKTFVIENYKGKERKLKNYPFLLI